MKGRLTAQIQEVIVLETLDGLELAADVVVLGGAKEVLDTGVGVVIAAEDLFGLVDTVHSHGQSV